MNNYKSIISRAAQKKAGYTDVKPLESAIQNSGGILGIIETLKRMKAEHDSPGTIIEPAAVLAALVYHAPARENHSGFRPNGISNLSWLRENLPYAVADVIATELNKHKISLQDFISMPKISISHLLEQWFSRPESHKVTRTISERMQDN